MQNNSCQCWIGDICCIIHFSVLPRGVNFIPLLNNVQNNISGRDGSILAVMFVSHINLSNNGDCSCVFPNFTAPAFFQTSLWLPYALITGIRYEQGNRGY